MLATYCRSFCNVASSVLTPACPLGLVRARISPLLCLMFASTWLIAKHLGVYNVYIQAIHTHRFTKSSRKTEATLIHSIFSILLLNGIQFCIYIRNELVIIVAFTFLVILPGINPDYIALMRQH